MCQEIFNFIKMINCFILKGAMYTYNPETHEALHMKSATAKRKHYRTKHQELFPAIKQREGEGCASGAFAELYVCVPKMYVQQQQRKAVNHAKIKSQSFENKRRLFLTPYLKMLSAADFLSL